MRVLVIDGQGGKVGAQLVSGIRERLPGARVTAVGTNAMAAAALRKAGADAAATGENAVIVACRTADVIVGPVGIVIADAMLGEITPAMARAVGQSLARRVLIPFETCNNIVVGAEGMSVSALLKKAVEAVAALAVEKTLAK